ncbi:protein FAM178B isoform X2 [Cygnus olor]|uniref:protein FAM178B isoform X2 n=1 Tax=Cygnus olor TaxID=8869 RepID=UPI001ADE06D1|nr:protein FAM178B isoform X2 [Cygnus olor]
MAPGGRRRRRGPAAALRWYQIPLSSARVPRSGLFSYGFQASLRSYQQLRAQKRLRVGRPVAPPPPGLLAPWPPPPSPPGLRRAPGAPGGTAPRRPKEPPSTQRGLSRGRQPPGPARPHDEQRDAAPRREEPGRSQHSPVLLGVAAASPGADSSRGQHTTARRAPQEAGDAAGDATTGRESPRDGEDDLIPLRELLLLGSAPPSPAEPRGQTPPPCPEPLANSLEALLREKREQRLAPALPRVPVDDGSLQEPPGDTAQLPEEHGLLLALFTVEPRLIPATHPGEPVFCARPLPPPALDARGLRPRSVLEGQFLCASPAGRGAFVRDGLLSLLYRSGTACPPPVLRWLFQLMSLRPDTTNAFQALWEIWLSAGGEPWCPTLQDIGQAFARLGADLGALRRRHLLPPELCPAVGRTPDPSCCPGQARLDATGTLALVTQLGDICKFLELCVAAQPRRYQDRARRQLVALLCFLGLDRALRSQPLPDLRHLLLCLLEGIADWQGQLPALCLSLCRLSQHHHNLLALVGLLPDVTGRGRELRRRLSLCVMARLLGEPPGTVLPLGAELPALSRLLELSRPDALQCLLPDGHPEDSEQEACYLSHSLLRLADAVVGSERPPGEQRGHLERLCAQLDRHFGTGLREGSGLLVRTQLKGLAALLYVKWQELLD